MSRIDVHHHFFPEFFTEALNKAGGDPSGWEVPPSWNLEADQQLAQELGAKASILSITAPGACIATNAKEAAKLARQCNEAAASVRDAHFQSYGFFACLPDVLEYPQETLEELRYALDELLADGVTLFTRYGSENKYLGHSEFRPLWKELNSRKAVVFIHPTHAKDTTWINEHLPAPMFDYPHETGRAAIDMIVSDVMPLIRDCKVILSHAGGTLPYLMDRVAGMMPYTPFTIKKTTSQLLHDASHFYFDTALSSSPGVLDLLLQFAQDGHVLFGSDLPNAPKEGIRYYTQNLDNHLGLEKSQKIGYDNAIALFPRLAE